jgi:hypothetical protein
MTPARWLILLASIILFCAGLMHIIGYTFLIPVLVKTGVDAKILGAIKAVWLVFSVELVILSPAFVWLGQRPGSRSLLLYLALIPLIDAGLMYYFVGGFTGFYMVAGGALVLLAGAWLLPRRSTSSGSY